ncbi:MAG: tryptophan synthase subunit alpha [Candidatus Altiarchaeota archaeon]|nr:tryptophan synthase subunit alpha [Candidatus Altiarchaeota archaeon]
MRIEEKFGELRGKKERALIGFVIAGDPTPEDTIDIVGAMIRGGVDIIELGLPFSDPIADGPTIQKAGERSLKAGMNSDVFFELVKKIEGIPKVCLTYYNLVLRRGLDEFARDCSRSGIDGLIVPDLPIEEAGPLLKACRRHKVNLIFLVAQTTTEERLQRILKDSSGFLYVVSLLGVTGVRDHISSGLKPLLERIKQISDEIPLAVGFGISKEEHVSEAIEAGADAVIVGSAFVRIIEENIGDREKMLKGLRYFSRRLKKATQNVRCRT